MEHLITELKKEHKYLLEVIEKLSQMPINSNQGQAILSQTKETLLKHLKKEEEFLYPTLRGKAKEDTALQKILETFGKELEKLSSVIMDYYNNYLGTKKDIDADAFRKDTIKIMVALKDRIYKEELILFKYYKNTVIL